MVIFKDSDNMYRLGKVTSVSNTKSTAHVHISQSVNGIWKGVFIQNEPFEIEFQNNDRIDDTFFYLTKSGYIPQSVKSKVQQLLF